MLIGRPPAFGGIFDLGAVSPCVVGVWGKLPWIVPNLMPMVLLASVVIAVSVSTGASKSGRKKNFHLGGLTV